MNSIITSGYGGRSYDKFADIEWTKNKHSILFSVKSSSINFNISNYMCDFNINTFNRTFDINIARWYSL